MATLREAAAGAWQSECAFFEPFVPDSEIVFVPVKQFESVAAFVDEDEEVS